MTLTILRSMRWVLRRMFNLDLSDLFLLARLGVRIWGRKTRRATVITSYQRHGPGHFSLLTLIAAEGMVIMLPQSRGLFC